MKLSLGFSPCPNDTFIFDALVNKKIDTGGLDFDVKLEDVETLNQWALEGRLDITKLSFPAFFQSLEHYLLLDSGSALGKGVGPLLVTHDPSLADRSPDQLTNEQSYILPGMHTTANLLFSFACPQIERKEFRIFSEIEDAVASKEFDFGVIIHENRFTYQDKGLIQVLDLGAYWEEKMNSPIPLGGIAIKQDIKRSTAIHVNKLIRESLEYAYSKYPDISDYVKSHSQTMNEDVMRKHIDLYVNNYSLDLGTEGKKAIGTLYNSFLKTQDADIEVEEEFLFF